MAKSYYEAIKEIGLFLNTLKENTNASIKNEEDVLAKMDKDKTYPGSMNEYSKNLCRRGCKKQIEEDKKSVQLIERLLIALDVMTRKDFDS